MGNAVCGKAGAVSRCLFLVIGERANLVYPLKGEKNGKESHRLHQAASACR
jgi:hypothetical protein